MSAAVQSDWIEWAGGECPVEPETRVQWLIRGETPENHKSMPIKGYAAEGFDWRWPAWGEHDGSADIIAYRVVSK